MFEIKKSIFIADCKLEYPNTHCMITRDLTVNRVDHSITGYGKTTCMLDDKFNRGFGEELATIRASINYLKQEEKLLISLTKQPEWRKEKEEEKELKELELTDYVRIPIRNGLWALHPGSKIYINKKD